MRRKPRLETPPEAALQWAYRWSAEMTERFGEEPGVLARERAAYIAGFMRGNDWRAGREARKRKQVRR